MKNIDVTLRDGGYRTGFEFPQNYAIRHAEFSVKAGFDWVEVGYLNGSLVQETSTGTTGVSSPKYIESIANEIGAEQTAIIAHNKNINFNLLKDAYLAGARLIRLCVNTDNFTSTLESVENAINLGYEVGINLTRVSKLSLEQVIALAEESNRTGASVFYLADSNGHLAPNDVRILFSSIKYALPELELGFHAHNHLGLALTNALVAAEVGVQWIDSAFQGMGKGAGNLISEYWIPNALELERSDHDERFMALVALSKMICELVPEASPRIQPTDLLTGYFDLGFEMQSHFGKSMPKAVDVAEKLSEGNIGSIQ